MSQLKSWNFHPLEAKGHCQCKAMAGNTFVTVRNAEDALPVPSFVLQIDENKNFSVAMMALVTPGEFASSVAYGRWTCCGNKWVGVAIAIVRIPSSPNTIYERVTIEVDVDTLVARVRYVFTAVPKGECVSSHADETTFVNGISTVQLQALGQNCGLDFDLPQTPL